MLTVVPLTLWFIPAGVLAWFLGVFALGLSGGWIGHDLLDADGPPFVLSNDEWLLREFLAFLAVLFTTVGTAAATFALVRHSPWAHERIMSQLRQLSPHAESPR